MAKLTRVFQNLFMRDGSAAHSEIFGSKAAGAPVPSLDPASIQSGPAFTGNGWLDAIVGANKQPFLEDMNAIKRLIFYQICSIFQDGIPAWDPATTYFTGSIVRKDGTSEMYGSFVDNNTGNALPAQTNDGFWQYLNPQSIPAGVLEPFISGVLPAGRLFCDGVSHPEASFPALAIVMATAPVWRTFNGAADPGVGNFRTPDLRGLTLMGAGTGVGFSARTLGQLVGEEQHVLTIPEMPSHAHGVTDPGHVHVTARAVGAANGGGSALLSLPQDNGHLQQTESKVTGITVNPAGGDGAHNNMQPTVGVNWLIKT